MTLNARLRLPGRLHTAESARTLYCETLKDEAISIDDIQNPDFWRNAGRQLRPGDRIEVLSADMTWCAELLVRSASLAEVIVGVLNHTKFGKAVDPAATAPSELSVKWRGPSAKFSVMRPDGQVFREHFDTKEQAATWIQNFERSKVA